MSHYSYVALDSNGREQKGLVDGCDQNEALRRIREMGYFPTRVSRFGTAVPASESIPSTRRSRPAFFNSSVPGKALGIFTRQLATLLGAGLPLLRGLQLLEEQETQPALRKIIRALATSIENGNTLSESLAAHPRTFNRLYVNMVKAGEIAGMLDLALQRLAEFMEKAAKIKGKVVAALFYPAAVMTVAIGILSILMVFVVPKFRLIFEGLLNGHRMPGFTLLVLGISEMVKKHFLALAGGAAVACLAFAMLRRAASGRKLLDALKLKMPVLGPVIRKFAIARFTRTLGTLISSGVPILQALTIVRETAGNVVVGDAVGAVHASVKGGDAIAAPLKASGVFPAMVVGMVDVGEQTGALPEMLMKIADNYDDEVDNAVSAMTSLLEPIMIVFLAVIVGSIVIALFMPLVLIIDQMDPSASQADG